MLLLLCTCIVGFGQSQSVDVYSSVLAKVFPKPKRVVDDVFFLQIIATFPGEPEVSILLMQRGKEGRVEISSALESVESRVNDEADRGSAKPVPQLAAEIKVEKEEGSVAAAQLAMWYQQFWTSLQTSGSDWQRRAKMQTATGTSEVTLDGGLIRILLEQGLTSLHLIAEDNEKVGLGQWVRQVRTEATKQLRLGNR